MGPIFRIGSFGIPVILPTFLAAYGLLWIFLRKKEAFGVVSNAVLNSIVMVFLIWKVSPLVFQFETVRNNILAVLYLPGSPWGWLIGGAATVFYLFVMMKKQAKPRDFLKNYIFTLVALLVLTAAGFFTVATLMSPNNDDTVFSDSSEQPLLKFFAENPSESSDPENAADEKYLADFAQDYLVINFWASWCPPCKAEIPELNEFYSDLTHPDIAFFTINLTRTETTTQDIVDIMQKFAIKFPVYLDTSGYYQSLFSVQSIPTTIILDKERHIVKRFESAVSKELLISSLP